MPKKKRKVKKKQTKRKRIISIILISFFLLLTAAFFYINVNFNKIISEKIYTLYNQSESAKYYSLHFDKLRVNILSMNVHVYHVHFKPKLSEHKEFFEQNGSLEINIGKILLENAEVFDFLSSNNISIEKFMIKDSEISIYKTSSKFQPFAFIQKKNANDSLKIQLAIQQISISKAALLYYTENNSETDNSFDDFNMEITNLLFDKSQSFRFSFDKLMASLNNVSYRSKKGAYISMSQFQFGLSSFQSQNTDNQFNFDFKDLFFHISQPQFITADSLYTFSAKELEIDKSKRLFTISSAKVHPNLSEKQFVRHFKYQNLRPDLLIEHIRMVNIDFDRFIDKKGLFTDSLIINGVQSNLFKSKLTPLNPRKIPNYLALQIRSIKYPLNIKVVEADNIEIEFRLQQENGKISQIAINKLSGRLYNVQNRSASQKLKLYAKGQVENSIPFSVTLIFDYKRDQFSYQGKVYKSNLKSISKMLYSFAPVEIKSGLLKSIIFQGRVSRTDSRGSMTFLYNKLNIQVQNKESENKSKIGRHILSFAANTYILSNNPTDASLPARKVEFFAQRDMNKGFIHILVQSVLSGIKESLLPSRENRQRYKQVKKNKKQ